MLDILAKSIAHAGGIEVGTETRIVPAAPAKVRRRSTIAFARAAGRVAADLREFLSGLRLQLPVRWDSPRHAAQ